MEVNYDYGYNEMAVSRILLDENYIVAKSEQRAIKYIYEDYTRFDKIIAPEDVDKFYELIKNGEASKIKYIAVRVYRRDVGYRNCFVYLINSNIEINGKKYIEIELRDVVIVNGRYEEIDIKVRKYRSFMAMVSEYFFDYNINTGILAIYGYKGLRAEILEKDLVDEVKKKCIRMGYVANSDIDKFNELFEKIVNCDDHYTTKIKTSLIHKGDVFEDVIFNCQSLYYNNEKIGSLGIISIENNNAIIDRTMSQNGISEYERDSFTGIYNKQAITEIAKDHVQMLESGNESFWLGICDVDNFKTVNDTYGHLFGDEVIYKFANDLQRFIGTNGLVGRIGGDEFMFLIDGKLTKEEVRLLLTDFRKSMEWAFVDKAPDFRFTTSIGLAYCPTDADDYERLFRTADKALYIAKEKGRDRYIFYREDMHGTLEELERGEIKYGVMDPFARVNMVSDMIIRMKNNGEKEIPGILNDIIDHLNIHGIKIYKLENDMLNSVYIAGMYDKGTSETHPFHKNMLEYYDKNGINKIDNINSYEIKDEEIFRIFREGKLCSSLQYLIGSKENVRYLVAFDIMGQHKRKWSNDDIESLYIIVKYMGEILP